MRGLIRVFVWIGELLRRVTGRARPAKAHEGETEVPSKRYTLW